MVWHGIHGVGTIVTSEISTEGPVVSAEALQVVQPLNEGGGSPARVHSDDRREARRCSTASSGRRRTAVTRT